MLEKTVSGELYLPWRKVCVEKKLYNSNQKTVDRYLKSKSYDHYKIYEGFYKVNYLILSVINLCWFKVRLSPFSCRFLLQWKSFRNDKKCFLFYVKSFFGIFLFLCGLFGYVGKWLVKNLMIDFKIYVVPDWT